MMPCNYTGLYDFDAYPELAKFGLVDYDVRINCLNALSRHLDDPMMRLCSGPTQRLSGWTTHP